MSKSKLILSEWNALYFSEIAFIDFIDQTVYSFFWDTRYVIRKQRLPKPKAKTIEFRTTKNLDVNSFVKDLEEIPWDSAYAYDNIDDIWHQWATLFNQILDKHVPLVQKKIGNRQIPWITAQIR